MPVFYGLYMPGIRADLIYPLLRGKVRMTGKRYNIGLITSGFHDEYSSSVYRGVAAAAEELDCNLFIFPCRFIDYQHDNFSSQDTCLHYSTTTAYASAENLDLLIITTGAVFKDPNEEVIRKFFASFGDIPIISLAVGAEGYPCIMHDCTKGLRSIFEHLLRSHGCKKLAFIAGPEHHPESNARLRVFRDVLQENGISAEKAAVLYTDFSEFSQSQIGTFLRANNFDFDAICCANDAIASAVYSALDNSGLRPGIDIIVTGYDNLSFASSSLPALTTVSADAADSGYRAVTVGIEALRSGQTIPSLIMPTYPIFRESCCGTAALTSSHSKSITDALEEMNSYLEHWIANYARSDDAAMPRFINNHSRTFLRLLLAELDDPQATRLSIDRLLRIFSDFVNSISVDTMSVNTVIDLLRVVHHSALSRAQSVEMESQVNLLFVYMTRIVNSSMNNLNHALTAETRHSMLFSNNLSQQVMHYEDGIGSTFTTIMKQLHELDIRRSFLYIDRQPRALNSLNDIAPFEKLELVAYHHGSNCFSLFDKPYEVQRHELIANPYISDKKRATMLVSPLYSTHEQYGVLVCEASYHHLSLFQTLMRQISAEMEAAYLFEELNHQLNETASRNAVLNRIATRDALTRCYNRRGFFERAGSAVVSPLNEGRRGFLIFSDLNDLKVINDNFGHDDGDFALCKVSDSLRECFGKSGIVGRIGGDEFVALWITDDENCTSEELYEKIRNTLSSMSNSTDKPYHISLSIGVYSFVCAEELELQTLIDSADQQQYIDKGRKSPSVYKSGTVEASESAPAENITDNPDEE